LLINTVFVVNDHSKLLIKITFFVFILFVQVLLATFDNIAVTLRLLSPLWFIIYHSICYFESFLSGL